MRWITHGTCYAAALAAVIVPIGCASPGPPLPPTLNLPQIVSATGLSATRVGDEVRLHWTTPTQTTDKLPIKGRIMAEICRDTVATGKGSGMKPCSAVTRVEVTAGASDAVDRLPSTLTTGPARMLVYRVQLRNAAGRTAGPSPEVMAAAGSAPGPVESLVGSVTKGGVMLRWRIRTEGSVDTEQHALSQGRVELERTSLDPTVIPGPERKGGLPGAQRQAAEVRLRAGAVDVGGTVDRTVEVGHSYSYTAQRVDLAEVDGQVLELRSEPTTAVALAVHNEFPPDVPSGLVAVPGLSGVDEAQKPTIDLSWEPDVEARVAGYRVYRREVGAEDSGAWVRLDPQLLTTAAYRDLTVVAGHRYTYRVTAVSTAGNESAPGLEATETARATP